ncbi:hypothetical protein BpHYR1_017078 [Brachionus plicatilis]|uniref:Uncharacterized protein n=1 Tax=Brachionus plicatilis TaxID=10195 RepID=A0A3M7RQK3_BRAPC|nr:hypothetical protein BpHYR1_017078 [Brachionus plicatilis]
MKGLRQCKLLIFDANFEPNKSMQKYDMSMHYDIDYRVNKSKIVNGLHCNGTTRVYCESGRMNVKENGMQELKPDAESDKSKKSYRHSTENLRDKSLFTSFDHLMSNFNLRKNKANSNTHLSYTNKVNNFNRNEKFTVDKKTNIKSLVHSSRKSSNPNNMMKSETMGRSGSRPKANSFIKRLSFRFKSNSTDSPQISQAQQNCFDYNASTFKGSNSMSIESNQKSSQEQAPLNLEINRLKFTSTIYVNLEKKSMINKN